ncbi:MAG: pseudouridine synthase [Bacteroidota bacterium]|nr:pseudouridine synthase [bacterium]NBP63442.1 pseudouridine synthase [Bacteroidota bacterium]
MLIALHKPYGVLSQFTTDGSKYATLASFNLPPFVYPIGRLDADSEGLLLLSDEASLNNTLLLPEHRHPRTYHVQVEGIPDDDDIVLLQSGTLSIQDHIVLPCSARLLSNPKHGERMPPIRQRKYIPDSWIEMTLHEGKNRQVRKMTAAIGHPTLRLIRVAIGSFHLTDIELGTWRELTNEERLMVFER